MNKEHQELEYHNNNMLVVFVGLLIGALAGAITMLLMAPQSGEVTRSQIQKKSIELRDQTTGMVDDVMSQLRVDGDKMTQNGRQKAKELLEQGQAMVAEQLDHVSEAAQAGKRAIQSA